MKKNWKKPAAKEVTLKDDSTTSDCQGKSLGCYAGSSCGSVKNEVTSKSRKKRPN